MVTVGTFTMGSDDIQNIMGQVIADDILNQAKTDKISINDSLFKDFLCVIFSSGNFEFLRVIAEKLYSDTRKEIILDFLNHVETMTNEGEEHLKKSKR